MMDYVKALDDEETSLLQVEGRISRNNLDRTRQRKIYLACFVLLLLALAAGLVLKSEISSHDSLKIPPSSRRDNNDDDDDDDTKRGRTSSGSGSGSASGGGDDEGALGNALGLSFAVGNYLRSVAENDARAAAVSALQASGGAAAPSYPWSQVIEPHRPTTFEARGCELCDDQSFSWSISSDTDGGGGGDESGGQVLLVLSGRSVTAEVSSTGAYTVTLQYLDNKAAAGGGEEEGGEGSIGSGSSSGTSIVRSSMSQVVMCKYVRREVRSLPDSERQQVLDAMLTLYGTDTREASSSSSSSWSSLAYATSDDAPAATSVGTEGNDVAPTQQRRRWQRQQRQRRRRRLKAAAQTNTTASNELTTRLELRSERNKNSGGDGGDGPSSSSSSSGALTKDIAYFVAKHLDGSAQRSCDGWHDGAGFYTHHTAFTLEFEQALQSVNPVVAMPFWDFTIDAHDQNYGTSKSGSDDWRTSSPIFSSEWFGSVPSSTPSSPSPSSRARTRTTKTAELLAAGTPDSIGDNDENGDDDDKQHVLDSGLFAFTRVLDTNTALPSSSSPWPLASTHKIANPWGLLRSPWNTNASPFVTRSAAVNGEASFGGSLPSCKAYHKCFLATSMADMNECLNGATHGSVHVEIGGLWGKQQRQATTSSSSPLSSLSLASTLTSPVSLPLPKTLPTPSSTALLPTSSTSLSSLASSSASLPPRSIGSEGGGGGGGGGSADDIGGSHKRHSGAVEMAGSRGRDAVAVGGGIGEGSSASTSRSRSTDSLGSSSSSSSADSTGSSSSSRSSSSSSSDRSSSRGLSGSSAMPATPAMVAATTTTTESLLNAGSAYQLLLMTKNLWRQGVVSCPDSCGGGTSSDSDSLEGSSASSSSSPSSSSSSSQSCRCGISPSAVAGRTSYEVLLSTVMPWLELYSDAISFDASDGSYHIDAAATSNFFGGDESAAWDDVLYRELADPGHVGEMYSSASPYDPSFWVLHGTSDRLVHWRRLVAASVAASAAATSSSSSSSSLLTGRGGSHTDGHLKDLATSAGLDESWGYTRSLVASSDTGVVCDWTGTAASPPSLPSCVVGTCEGHGEQDALPFDSFAATSKTRTKTTGKTTTTTTTPSGYASAYTNAQMWAFLSPDNADLPYMYDDFKWPHCDEEGFAFGVQSDESVSFYQFTLPTGHHGSGNE